jgi:hypothetical protein
MWVCKQNFLAEKTTSIFWEVNTWSAVEVHRHFKGEHCLQLEVQGAWQTSNDEELTAHCLLLAHCLACASWQHCVTFKKMVTAVRYSNPVSWVPLFRKMILMEPQGLLTTFDCLFTSTINQVSVEMVFLGNVRTFILKEMRSVNLKTVVLKFKITLHIFWVNMHTDTRISYELKTPIIWKSTYYCMVRNAL